MHVPDAAAVNPNAIKMLIANGLSTLLTKGNPVFSNGTKNLPRNPWEKSKIDSFASSLTKNIVASSGRSRFPKKIICCIAFGST